MQSRLACGCSSSEKACRFSPDGCSQECTTWPLLRSTDTTAALLEAGPTYAVFVSQSTANPTLWPGSFTVCTTDMSSHGDRLVTCDFDGFLDLWNAQSLCTATTCRCRTLSAA